MTSHLRISGWRSLPIVLLLLAFATPAWPALAQDGGATLTLDSPTNAQSATLGQDVAFTGWAAHGSGPGTGVDRVVVLDAPMGAGGKTVVEATYGRTREDLGAMFGTALTNSGFIATWKAAGSTGNRTFWVYAHSTGNDSWTNKTVTVDLTGTPTPSSTTTMPSRPASPFGSPYTPAPSAQSGSQSGSQYSSPSSGQSGTQSGSQYSSPSSGQSGTQSGSQYSSPSSGQAGSGGIPYGPPSGSSQYSSPSSGQYGTQSGSIPVGGQFSGQAGPTQYGPGSPNGAVPVGPGPGAQGSVYNPGPPYGGFGGYGGGYGAPPPYGGYGGYGGSPYGGGGYPYGGYGGYGGSPYYR